MHLVYPSIILACLGILVVIPIYVFYWKGAQLRLKSPFAQELEIQRQKRMGRRSTTGQRGGQKPSAAQEKHVEQAKEKAQV